MQVLPLALDEASMFGGLSADDEFEPERCGLLHALLQPADAASAAGLGAQTASAKASGDVATAEALGAPCNDGDCGARWIVLDGPIASSCTDRLARLMLGRPVRLGAGPIVRAQPSHRLLWETNDLAGASPALLAGVGVCAVHTPVASSTGVLLTLMDDMLARFALLDQVGPCRGLAILAVAKTRTHDGGILS